MFTVWSQAFGVNGKAPVDFLLCRPEAVMLFCLATLSQGTDKTLWPRWASPGSSPTPCPEARSPISASVPAWAVLEESWSPALSQWWVLLFWTWPICCLPALALALRHHHDLAQWSGPLVEPGCPLACPAAWLGWWDKPWLEKTCPAPPEDLTTQPPAVPVLLRPGTGAPLCKANQKTRALKDTAYFSFTTSFLIINPWCWWGNGHHPCEEWQRDRCCDSPPFLIKLACFYSDCFQWGYPSTMQHTVNLQISVIRYL